jgi:hypothetical protein
MGGVDSVRSSRAERRRKIRWDMGGQLFSSQIQTGRINCDLADKPPFLHRGVPARCERRFNLGVDDEYRLDYELKRLEAPPLIESKP